MNITAPGIYENISEDVVVVFASGVEIRYSEIGEIRVRAEENITDINVHDSTIGGFVTYLTTPVEISSFTLESNLIKNGEGIRITAEPDSNAVMRDISVRDNKISKCAVGVKIRNTGTNDSLHSKINISYNQIADCEQLGIATNYFDEFNIEGNQCYRNGITGTLGGIWVCDSTNGKIKNNNSSYNLTKDIDGCGILVDTYCSDVDVLNNICIGNKGTDKHNSGAGIMLLSVNNVLAMDNIMKHNKHDLYLGGKEHTRSYSLSNIYDSIYYSDVLPETASAIVL